MRQELGRREILEIAHKNGVAMEATSRTCLYELQCVMGELRAHTTLRYHVDVNRVKWNAVDTIESYRDHCRQLPGGSETIRETSAAVMSKDERKRLLHSLSVSEFFAALYVRMSAQLYLEVSSAFPPLSVDDIREHACVNAVCNGRLRRQSTP